MSTTGPDPLAKALAVAANTYLAAATHAGNEIIIRLLTTPTAATALLPLRLLQLPANSL